MKKIFTLLIIIGVGLTLDSCYYDKYQSVVNDPTAAAVSFATDIQPIFNANCIVCHPSVNNPDLTQGNSYIFLTVTDPGLVVPNNAVGSELYQRLTGIGGIMPPSGSLSNSKVALIKNWINQGAKNN